MPKFNLKEGLKGLKNVPKEFLKEITSPIKNIKTLSPKGIKKLKEKIEKIKKKNKCLEQHRRQLELHKVRNRIARNKTKKA